MRPVPITSHFLSARLSLILDMEYLLGARPSILGVLVERSRQGPGHLDTHRHAHGAGEGVTISLQEGIERNLLEAQWFPKELGGG